MKTFHRLKTIIRYVLINITVILLIFNQLQAQSFENSNTNIKVWQSELTDEQRKYTTDLDQEEAESVSNDVKVLSSGISTREKPIELKVIAGQRKTQTIMIQNLGVAIRWKIDPEGSEKLLYRLYVEDRYLMELSEYGKRNINKTLSYIDLNTSLIPPELDNNIAPSSSSGNSSIGINLYSQIPITDQAVFESALDNRHSSEFSYDADSPQQLETLVPQMNSEGRFFFKKIDNDVRSDFSKNIRPTFQNETHRLSSNTKRFDDLMKIFSKWYQFEECGYSVFKPQTDVWEVSQDNGEHWQQILTINDQSYVVNAFCFNPVEFLERQYLDDQISFTPELTTLQEFIKKAQYGPSVSPTSGIIPANTDAKIEFSVDATSVEVDTYQPMLKLMDEESMESVAVVPLRLAVIPEMGKVSQSQLFKQSHSDQIPDKFGLFQNYPNPFNPSTTIKYSIPKTSFVSLIIYDIVGGVVRVLAEGQINAGYYDLKFDAAGLPSGVYFYKLQAGDFVETKKMVLMK